MHGRCRLFLGRRQGLLRRRRLLHGLCRLLLCRRRLRLRLGCAFLGRARVGLGCVDRRPSGLQLGLRNLSLRHGSRGCGLLARECLASFSHLEFDQRAHRRRSMGRFVDHRRGMHLCTRERRLGLRTRGLGDRYGLGMGLHLGSELCRRLDRPPLHGMCLPCVGLRLGLRFLRRVCGRLRLRERRERCRDELVGLGHFLLRFPLGLDRRRVRLRRVRLCLFTRDLGLEHRIHRIVPRNLRLLRLELGLDLGALALVQEHRLQLL